jgi:hypothetical protein
MDLITLDFETRWGGDYTLSKMSTEAYVRDERFHAHGVGIKINDEQTKWYPDEEAILVMACLDIENSAVLAHHAHFDGFILSHQFHRQPKLWFDTLSMGRALHGVEIGLGLGKLAEFYGVGIKNTAALMETKGLHRLPPDVSQRTGVYCCNDVDMTYDLFNLMRVKFPRAELEVIDMVIRMFTEPVLHLDGEMLAEYLEEIQAGKLALLLEAGIGKDDLMSNPKFAEVLKSLGIRPPQKLNPKGKITWAFAKTDPGMKALAEHPDLQVQAVMAARTGTKSTIAESRAANFLAVSGRGVAPVYLKYSGAAQTHRFSGGDGTNWQNMTKKSKLRRSVQAPPGHVLVVVDSSNIESRVLDYIADQKDALETYRAADNGTGPDVYCVMGGRIYNRVITPADENERQLGKVAKLGLGFGMGPEKFYDTARVWGVKGLTGSMAEVAVQVYREGHPRVMALHTRCENSFPYMRGGSPYEIDPRGILKVAKGCVLLPNGLTIRYPELHKGMIEKQGASGPYQKEGWKYNSGKYGWVSVYGGKVVENIVQALARIIVIQQTIQLRKRYKRVVLSVHDEAVVCVPFAQAEACMAAAIEEFRTPPKWALDIPLNAKAAFNVRYGDAK